MKRIVSILLAFAFLASLSGPGFAERGTTFSCANVTQIPQVQCEALVALYNSTNGPGWYNNDNWLVTNTPGSWYGVTVSGGHVTNLSLTLNHLTGSIPPELGSLSNLQWLDLSYNGLTGIPPELGNLTNLQNLNLSINHLTGSIPSQLGGMINLSQLYLYHNQLTGSIPPELGGLANLQSLSLWTNQLTGSIPPELGGLANLQSLSLQNNQLTGSIPPELGGLANLQSLSLWTNQLTGSIPPQLGSLTSLQVLSLGGNQLTGSIPLQLGNLGSLQYLDLRDNQLTGSIPSQLGSLGSLESLYLSNNQLTGSIPSQLGSLGSLESLLLDNNQLTGSIPPELGSLGSLTYLWLYNNQLTGSIPPELGSLGSLESLYLSNNQLTGSIPSQLGSLGSLESLLLDNNQLTGSIPLSFTSLVNLDHFYFNNTTLCEPADAAFQTWKATVPYWTGTGLTCVADIGFRPYPDGYSFKNWGSINWEDYTLDDMLRMFGDDAVCRVKDGSTCVPRAQAVLWNIKANRAMAGAHCDGMATTSLRFFKDMDAHEGFDNPYNLLYNNSVQVRWQGEPFTTTTRRNIAYFFVEQMVNPVKEHINTVRQQTPEQILNQLTAAMNSSAQDYPTLFFYETILRNRGHSVTPYAIMDKGNGEFWIMVYDNNHPYDKKLPNDDIRHVVIDTVNDTWSYDFAEGDTWSGNAGTHTLGITPILLYAERPYAPWWWYLGKEGDPESQVWFNGTGHLLITNSTGQRLGYDNGQFVSDIPGAYGSVIPSDLGVELEPIYSLPLADTYTIALNGLPTKAAGEASLSQFGPGYAVVLEDIWMDSGTADTLTIATDGTSLTYLPSQAQEATLGLALDIGAASYLLEVRGTDILANEARTLTADTAQGKLVIDSSQATSGLYNLVIQRSSASGWQPFYHRDIPLAAGATHYADFNGWAGTGTLTLDMDTNSDGNIDDTLSLENQMTYIYLPVISH